MLWKSKYQEFQTLKIISFNDQNHGVVKVSLYQNYDFKFPKKKIKKISKQTYEY